MMVISMDVTSDQTMSSSPPQQDLGESGAPSQSPSPFQNKTASLDGDEHEDENSKCSGQTIVTRQHQQQQPEQQQPPPPPPHEPPGAGGPITSSQADQQEQRMVMSCGSSFDEDDKRLLMNVDVDEQQPEESMRANLSLEQAELEARLAAQAKSTRFRARPEAGGDQMQRPVESSLVAQMRDIVEGGSSSAGSAARQATGQVAAAKNNNEQPPAENQPKSSSDSLNNQNENGHSRASIDSAYQKRLRHSRAHCRHHHNAHHHHHHHNHRHRQSISGGSLPGQVETGPEAGSGELAGGKSASGSQQVSQHAHHHHHGRHRHHHANSSHPHHYSHHHHSHHHHQYEHKRANASKRNSIQRLSLAMIEPAGNVRPEEGGGSGGDGPARDQSRQQGERGQAGGSNNSSMASVSSAAAKQPQQHQQQQVNNPNQSSNLESKSSESPPSDDLRHNTGQQVESTSVVSNKELASGHGHHHHGHHHHHHHHHQAHHCHHRSHKKRLVLDAGNNQPEAIVKSDNMQPVAGGAGLMNESSLSCDSVAARRRPLQDLASGANISASGGNDEDGDNDRGPAAADQTRHYHAAHPHNHHHHHHHHHQSHHLRHHHHHHAHQCATHKQQSRAGDGGLPTPPQQASEPATDEQGQRTQGRPMLGPHHHHQHHHCVHRHHRHHHHHHNNNNNSGNNNQPGSGHAHHHHHHHQCKQQRAGHTHRTRQKSVSQTNVDQGGSARDSNKTLDRSVEGAIGAEADEPMKGERPELESERPQVEDTTSQAVNLNAASDEVVKMETSPPPVGAKRRQSMNAARQAQQAASLDSVAAGQVQRPDELIVTGSILSLEQQVQQKQPPPASDSDEASRKGTQGPSRGLNQEAMANQENLRSGDGGQAAGQQQANKLTRQMSSQSSRRSDKEEQARGNQPPGDMDGQSQGEHLRECAERALQPAAINQGSNETRQIIESSVPSDRRCRLCWCCCCPCSALSARDGSNRTIEKPKAAQGPPSSPVGSSYPSLPNVPLEEIRSWGESFDKLMKCSDGRKVFQDFLRCEYSEENILFWAACEELKKEKDSKNIASKARDIYEDYISILSSKEVSLDSRVRDIINNNIKKPTSNIFDEAQLQIYTLMHRDSYPRFINSIMYKKLAQIPMSNSRKSSS